MRAMLHNTIDRMPPDILKNFADFAKELGIPGTLKEDAKGMDTSTVARAKLDMINFFEHHLGVCFVAEHPKLTTVLKEIIDIFGWMYPGDTMMACIGVLKVLAPSLDVDAIEKEWFHRE